MSGECPASGELVHEKKVGQTDVDEGDGEMNAER